MLQLEAFRRREGCFGSERTLMMRDKMPAYQWWGANVSEDEAEELKTVALKVNFCSSEAYVPMSEAFPHDVNFSRRLEPE
jgi:hypothetical protein